MATRISIETAEKVKTINAFKTTDGKVFEIANAAERHQARIDFCEWYEQGNELYGMMEGSRIEARELLEWLEEHSEKIGGWLRFII